MKNPWDATAQLWPWAAHCGSCWHLPLPSTVWLVCHHVRAFGKQLLLMFPVVMQDTRLHNQPLEIWALGDLHCLHHLGNAASRASICI